MTLLRTKNASLSPPKTTEWPTWMNTFVWHNHPKNIHLTGIFMHSISGSVSDIILIPPTQLQNSPRRWNLQARAVSPPGCESPPCALLPRSWERSDYQKFPCLNNTAVALLPMSNTNHTNLSHGEEVLRLLPIDSRAPDLLRTIVNTMCVQVLGTYMVSGRVKKDTTFTLTWY